jgi:hypothetical protein
VEWDSETSKTKTFPSLSETGGAFQTRKAWILCEEPETSHLSSENAVGLVHICSLLLLDTQLLYKRPCFLASTYFSTSTHLWMWETKVEKNSNMCGEEESCATRKLLAETGCAVELEPSQKALRNTVWKRRERSGKKQHFKDRMPQSVQPLHILKTLLRSMYAAALPVCPARRCIKSLSKPLYIKPHWALKIPKQQGHLSMPGCAALFVLLYAKFIRTAAMWRRPSVLQKSDLL